MFEIRDKIYEIYKDIYEEIFERLIFEGNHIIILFEDFQDKGLKIKSINDCKTPDELREKLFFIRKNAFDILPGILKKQTRTEKTRILEFSRIKLIELKNFTIKTETLTRNGTRAKTYFLNCKYKDEKDNIYENIDAILIGKGFTSGFDNKIDTFIKEYYKEVLRFGAGEYVNVWEETIKEIENETEELINFYKHIPAEANEIQNDREEIPAKPVFKEEYIIEIYNIFKVYFSHEQQEALLNLLESGKDGNEMLLFADNAYRLADAFRILKNNEIITGCEKKDLVEWVIRNFKYKKRGTNTYCRFNRRTLEDYIYSPPNSKAGKMCMNPINEIREIWDRE